MRMVKKNIKLPMALIIMGAIAVVGCTEKKGSEDDSAIAAEYKNYQRAMTEDYSEEERKALYNYRHRNEPRLSLAKDLPGPSEPGGEVYDDPKFSYGLKGDYSFTFDWFTRKSPAWEVALKDFAGKPDLQYLEIGVYEGRAVVWMLENILTNPTSHVTGIDIFYLVGESVYSPEQQKIYEDNVIAAGGEGRSTTINDFSQTALRKLPLDHYDIIYIDGAHSSAGVLEDAVLALRLLKEGGVLIFDDYRWFKTIERAESPRYAIDIFIELYGEQFDVLHTESQVFLVRKQVDSVSKGLNLDAADVEADAET
jgi:predicted O-methyltransferase YrrM